MAWDQGGPPADYQSGSEIEGYLQAMAARDPGFELGSFSAPRVAVQRIRLWASTAHCSQALWR